MYFKNNYGIIVSRIRICCFISIFFVVWFLLIFCYVLFLIEHMICNIILYKKLGVKVFYSTKTNVLYFFTALKYFQLYFIFIPEIVINKSIEMSIFVFKLDIIFYIIKLFM